MSSDILLAQVQLLRCQHSNTVIAIQGICYDHKTNRKTKATPSRVSMQRVAVLVSNVHRVFESLKNKVIKFYCTFSVYVEQFRSDLLKPFYTRCNAARWHECTLTHFRLILQLRLPVALNLCQFTGWINIPCKYQYCKINMNMHYCDHLNFNKFYTLDCARRGGC